MFWILACGLSYVLDTFDASMSKKRNSGFEKKMQDLKKNAGLL
jgi:hypothetical protein